MAPEETSEETHLRQPKVSRSKKLNTTSTPNQEGQPPVEWLSYGDLVVDDRYQRSIQQPKVYKIATEFDPDVFGVLTVSIRDDGTKVLIDGQQRTAGLREMDWNEDQKVPCVVHRNLSLQEEARIFVLTNEGRTKPKPYDIFKADVIAGRPEAVEIQEVFDKHDLEVTRGPHTGGMRAIGTCRKIYRQGGALLLGQTIDTLIMAYGKNSVDTFNHDLMWPVAAVIWANKGLSRKRLAESLSDLGGPSVIVSRGKIISQNTDRKAYNEVANIVIRAYNKRLSSKNRLAEVHDGALFTLPKGDAGASE